MADMSDSKAMRRKSRGKEVAKERKVPRRGMGVARLERMRLLEQKGFMEEDGQKKARTAPLFSYFLPLSYLLQRFPQVDAERGALELAWNRGIGEWQFFESSVTTPSFLERMGGVHAVPRDFSFPSMDGNNIVGYTDSSFTATTKLQGNNVETSDWSDACLDLSLSTAPHRIQEERNLSKENMGCTQEERGAATGMPRAGPELWEAEAEKGEEANGSSCRCSSCTKASQFHYVGESSFLTSQASSLPSPSLQLTLGLPS